MTFTDNRAEYDKILEQINMFARSYVTVGFQDGTVTRSQTQGTRTKQAGISMAQIAFENEFGTNRIPARPFLRPAIDENQTRINRFIVRQYNMILAGTSDARRALNTIGLFGVDLVRRQILSVHTPPNSPRTIAEKGSSKPLIDFGQMIQSVQYRVET